MKKAAISLIRWYQAISRPLANQGLLITPWSGCRHWPTCSEYAIQEINRHGALRGIASACIRIVRCNPFVHPQ